MKINTEINIDLTPRELSEMILELDTYDQAYLIKHLLDVYTSNSNKGDSHLEYIADELFLEFRNDTIKNVMTILNHFLFLLTDETPTKTNEEMGQWKTNKSYKNIIFCSECGEPFEKRNKSEQWNFCPGCGHPMMKGTKK